MFRNVTLFWKMMLLASLTPVAILLLTGIALFTTGRLGAEYDTLYSTVLIPISKLDQGNLARALLAADLRSLSKGGLTAADRETLLTTTRARDKAVFDIITHYEQEWLTTLRPEFTAMLARLGQSDLQTQEGNALGRFHTAYSAYAPLRDALLSGAVDESNYLSALAQLNRMQTAFDDLVRVNMQYAGFSNTAAQTTLRNARLALLAAGVALAALALVTARWLAQVILRPVAGLTRATQLLAEGDLEIHLTNASDDEVGQMARAFARMVRYQQMVAGAAQKIAQNDLTETLTPQSEKDVLGNAFAQMTSNLRGALGQVAANACRVDSAADHMAVATRQTEEATAQIATTMQQVAQGIAQQTQAVSRTVLAMEEMQQGIRAVAQGAREQSAAVEQMTALSSQLGAVIQRVAGEAQAVTEDSGRAAQAAREGAQIVDETIRGMGVIKHKVGLSAEKVHEMGGHSEQIGTIVETIEDIASQTNLLALNAAIEAARAGDQGRGFAVVAGEVRKLAERASTATKEIAELVRAIQNTVTEAVVAMQAGAKEVATGEQRAQTAGRVLKHLQSAAEAVSAQSQSTLSASQQMRQLSDEMARSAEAVTTVAHGNTAATEHMSAQVAEATTAVDHIAGVSEANRAAVEEVSVSTEEMSAQVTAATASAHALREMASALQSVAAQFTLATDSGPAL